MTEAVASTTSFDLPVDEIIELALEGLGGETISGKEAKLARTSLNLVLIDLQNRGVAPLSSMEIVSVDLASGSADDYSLGSDVVNVQQAVVAVSVSGSGGTFTDLPLSRLSYDEWLRIPTKDSNQGRPTHYFVDKQRSDHLVSFWPKPDSSTKYRFKAWTLKKTADITKSYQLVDVPRVYLTAIVRGLRYYMADLRGSQIPDKQWYKLEYEEALQRALDEDRERVDLQLYPANKPQMGS